jgi:Methyltransferase domain
VIGALLAHGLFWRGLQRLQSGRRRRAAVYFTLAARISRATAHYHGAAAAAARQEGDIDRAAWHCERALRIDPHLEPVHEQLAGLFLHGEQYSELLARIHEALRPRTYVEIGVHTGASLRFALPQTRVVGIDPEPRIGHPLPANVQIYAETSDAFFSRADVREKLGGLPVDLAFIDGMHHFEFALRDFMNLERLCGPESTILLHDCFPHDRRTAQRERVAEFWTGDVWRLVVLLKRHRPGLSVHTVAAPPSGLAIVRGLDPASTFLADNFDRLRSELMALDYDFLENGRAAKLNLFPNDWPRVRGLLAR